MCNEVSGIVFFFFKLVNAEDCMFFCCCCPVICVSKSVSQTHFIDRQMCPTLCIKIYVQLRMANALIYVMNMIARIRYGYKKMNMFSIFYLYKGLIAMNRNYKINTKNTII